MRVSELLAEVYFLTRYVCVCVGGGGVQMGEGGSMRVYTCVDAQEGMGR